MQRSTRARLGGRAWKGGAGRERKRDDGDGKGKARHLRRIPVRRSVCSAVQCSGRAAPRSVTRIQRGMGCAMILSMPLKRAQRCVAVRALHGTALRARHLPVALNENLGTLRQWRLPHQRAQRNSTLNRTQVHRGPPPSAGTPTRPPHPTDDRRELPRACCAVSVP